ncbi:MAG: hypothetical protein RI935_674 [Candidatus Parcubacteria bacterium]|jgi:predicted glutamine amidotransferase
MCRLLAFAFTSNNKDVDLVDVLGSFRELALTGLVPKTIEPGHEDGWGLAIYKDEETSPLLYKSTKSAKRDETFQKSFLTFKQKGGGIAHLRKKTVGESSLLNTHPFVSGVFSFMHNGTVTREKDGPYPDTACECVGTTDSERLFQRFLQIRRDEGKSSKEAFIQMLNETRARYPMFSALNTILCDGATLYIARCINEDSPQYVSMGFDEYYSLYLGRTNSKNIVVSSEKILDSQIKYRPLKNFTLTSVDIKSMSTETISI